MRLPRFELLQPRSVDEAVDFLAEHGTSARPAGGGTDLFPRMKYGVASPKSIVSLKAIPHLAPSDTEDGVLTLSAFTKLSDVVGSALVKQKAPMLAQAALSVASNQIRQMATLGGNLCLENRCVYYNQSHSYQFVEPCFKRDGSLCYLVPQGKKCWALSVADTAPALIALEAEILIAGAEKQRKIPVQELFTGDPLHPLALETSELVTDVLIPAAHGNRATRFVKFSLRGGLEFALTNVAVALDLAEDGLTCTSATVVAGAVRSAPIRANTAEAARTGQKISQDLIHAAAQIAASEITPLPRYDFSAAYLRKCLEVHTREALLSAVQDNTAV